MIGDDDDNTGGAGAIDLDEIDTSEKLEDEDDEKSPGGAGDTVDEEEAADDEEEKEEGEDDEKPAGGKDQPKGAEKGKDAAAVADTRVPYARLKKAIDDRRTATARVHQLENELTAARGGARESPILKLEAKLDPLYEQVETARAEGKAKEAATLQREIDKINRTISEAKTEEISTKQALTVAWQGEYNAYLNEVELRHPELNPDAEGYDQEVVDEVMELQRGFEANGYTPKMALEKALAYAQPSEVAVSRSGAKTETARDKTMRARNNVGKKIDAAKRMAPNVEDAGRDHKGGKLNPLTMTDDEWDKVPESTKARNRGDYL